MFSHLTVWKTMISDDKDSAVFHHVEKRILPDQGNIRLGKRLCRHEDLNDRL